jgi:integral membrane sensor domain MASE1
MVRIDPRLATVSDVGRLALTFLTCAIPTAVIGMLTLLGDGLISHSDAIKTAVNWWQSDSIAIISFAPLLLIYGSPRLTHWMRERTTTRYSADRTIHRTFANWMMIGLQGGSVLFALWLVFFCDVAIPYQPVYILFIPLIWIAVQHGLPGATIATCVINVTAMFTADATHSAGTALPRLQLAMLALALTGLCVGAAVSERKRVEQALEKSESNLRHAQQVATVGSWHVNIPEDELTWSEETYRLFNLPREMPIDINLVEKYIHPDDRPTFRTKWAGAFSTGRYEYEHRNGS